MNLPTIGALIRQFPISKFSICSKVISFVNQRVGEAYQLTPEMTGEKILEIYDRLPYEIQQELYDLDIINRIEEQSFYTEVKVVSDNDSMRKIYDNNMSSTLILDINVIFIILFGATALVYRQNTITHGDNIPANLLTTVLSILKYLTTSLI